MRMHHVVFGRTRRVRRGHKRAQLAYAAGLGCAAAVASAAFSNPIVNTGSYVAAPNTNVSVPITVVDPAANPVSLDIEGMDLLLQLDNGMGTSPAINSVDALTGTVWPSGSTQDADAGNMPQFQGYTILTPSYGVAINDNGLLATASLASGGTEGVYSINLVGTAYTLNDSQFFDGNGNPVPGIFNNGYLTVTTHQWTGKAGTAWETGGSWSAGSKPTGTDSAYFPAAVPSSGPSIILGTGESVGAIAFDGSYTFNGGSLTIGSPSSAPPGGNIAVAPGVTATINSPLSLPQGTSVFGGGTLVINSSATVGGPVSVNQGALIFGATQHLPALSIGNGPVPATVTLTKTPPTAAGRVLVTQSLSLAGSTGAWLGTLDLGNGGLVVEYPAAGPSPIDTIADQITSGYAGGTWTGTGITSSAAATVRPGHGAVGYGEASDVLNLTGIATGTFMGQTVDASSILARYTTYGDANLDGKVDFSDFVTLSEHFGQTVGPGGWAMGDFNYDGKVDFADFILLSSNFGTLAPAQTAQIRTWETTVPEPASLGILAIGAMGLLTRRRRKRIARSA